VGNGVTFVFYLIYENSVHEFSFVQERAVLFNFKIIKEAVPSVFCVVLKELTIAFRILRG
jgi:hypothetical protein